MDTTQTFCGGFKSSGRLGGLPPFQMHAESNWSCVRWSAPVRLAPVRLASVRSAPVRSAAVRLEPESSAP